MPPTDVYLQFESKPCKQCPNSWKIVSTSDRVNKEGFVVRSHTSYNPGDEIQLEKEIRDLLSISDTTSVIKPEL